MAQDADSMNGIPAVVSPDASGAYSPCSNVRLKHEYSPCTTQASLSAITDVNPSLNVAYLPTTLPPEVHETRRSETVTSPSQNQGDRVDKTECGGSSPTPQQLGSGQHSQDEEYNPGDLPQRMQDLQTSFPTDFNGYSLDTVFEPAAGSVSNSQPNDAYNVNNCDGRSGSYNLDVQTQSREGWPSWEHCPTLQEAHYEESFYPPDHIEPPLEEGLPTSSSYAGAVGGSGLPCPTAKVDDLDFTPMHEHYKHRNPTGGIPTTTLSSCSDTLVMGSENTAPLPDPDNDMDADMVYNPGLYDAEDVLGSRSSAEPVGGKSDEPYAQLIYKAFLSRPNKSMTLQEIYQWFRENTDKAKSTGKGWQNSIRHNLSMNGAFTKRSSNQSALNNDGSLSLDASGADGRKSTEWYLEPKYYCGVESTTRYRKGNSKNIVRVHRDGRAIDGNTKAVSGRKGGYQAAHHRKRVKAEHQQAARPRNHRLPRCGSSYPADEDGYCFIGYPPQLPPNTSSPYYPPNSSGLTRPAVMPPSRQSHPGLSYFSPPELGTIYEQHGRGLPSDLEHSAEPTTPPASGHDIPVDDVSFGTKYYPYPPGFITSPEYGYQSAPAVKTSADYAQQPGYTLEQVTGICEPPSGIEQPPLFVHGNNLTAEDAAALFNVNPSWANAGPYCG
ncbi:hypothetical protein diail_7180 [Diaporthe ilicicola]|nr:hypothetical protein diail_7180 [Diaporthe ilicicola]